MTAEVLTPPLKGQPTKAWAALSQWLPPHSPDNDYWWHLTGLHLANMLEAAGYRLEKQYEALVFHYHWIVSCAHDSLRATVFDSHILTRTLGPLHGPGPIAGRHSQMEIFAWR